MRTNVPLTYEAYQSGAQFGGSYEIRDGVLVPVKSASGRHQECVANIALLFLAFQKETKAGRTVTAPYDVLIRKEPLCTRQPDVFFAGSERLKTIGKLSEVGPLPFGPELIVEVLSVGETPRFLAGKLSDYASAGTQEAWLVSPNAETLHLYHLTEGAVERRGLYGYGDTVTSEAFPALSVALSDIFSG